MERVHLAHLACAFPKLCSHMTGQCTQHLHLRPALTGSASDTTSPFQGHKHFSAVLVCVYVCVCCLAIQISMSCGAQVWEDVCVACVARVIDSRSIDRRTTAAAELLRT